MGGLKIVVEIVARFLKRPGVRAGMLMLFLAGYGLFIGENFAPVAAGADAGGYFNSAKQLLEGRLGIEQRIVPEYTPATIWEFSPLGYIGVEGSTWMTTTYPIGLPLHYAAAAAVGGWYWGPLVIGVLAAMGAVAGCYFCARELGISRGFATAGGAALAVSPVFLHSSFVPMSDTVATAWGTFAVYAALRTRRSQAGGWALVSGLAFSLAVLVRPTSVVLAPVFLLALRGWRSWLWAALGGLPGAVLLGWYQHAMYGSVLSTGYGDMAHSFSREYVGLSVKNYAMTLPWALPLAVVAVVALPFLGWRRDGRGWLACVAWVAVLAVFYAYYFFTHLTWWYLRFLLPAFPALVILGLAGLERVRARVPARWEKRAHAMIVAGVAVVSLAGAIHGEREHHVMLMKSYQQPYVEVCGWAREHLPADSLIATMQMSSAFYFYTDFPIYRWDLVSAENFTKLKSALKTSGRPFYAVVFPFEENDERMLRMKLLREKVYESRGVSVWKCTPLD